MKDIYTYIKQTAKRKNISIEGLHKQCGVARTSMYYIIKGITIPSDEIRAKLKAALNLNDAEAQELDYYYRLADTDELTYLARNELKGLLYSKSHENIEPIEFIFYDTKKIIYNYDDILGILQEHLDDEYYICDIKILNCTKQNYLQPIFEFIQNIRNEHKWNIQHLVRFFENDHQENISIFKTLLPLMQCANYDVFYADAEQKEDHVNLFYDTIIIKLQWGKEEANYLLINFSYDTYSDCYGFTDVNFYNLLLKRYNCLKKEFSTSLIEEKNIHFFSEMIVNLSRDNDMYMVKENPCYDEIPIDVYRQLTERIDENHIKLLFHSFGKENGTRKEALLIYDMLIQDIQKRIDFSHKKLRCSVYTKEGMIKFAQTGRLSDDYPFIPDFNKEEIRRILTYLKERTQDKKYNIYITNCTQIENMFFVVFDNGGIFIEYVDQQGQIIANRYIKQRKICNTFIDFITRYVPDELALNQKECENFIDDLIETYCTN